MQLQSQFKSLKGQYLFVFVILEKKKLKEIMDQNHTSTVSGEHATDDVIVCYSPTMITTFSVWKGDNPLDYSLPLFVLQLTLVVGATRLFVFILKPFRQPRVIAEILVSFS